MAIKHTIKFKNLEPEERFRSLVENLIAKLERKARNFSPDALFLTTSIDQNKVRTLYQVSITMEVPRKTLAAKGESHEIEAAIKDAFAEIERQLVAHKSRLRGEHLRNATKFAASQKF